MKKILLTKGKVAIIDDADYASVSQFKWHAIEKRGRFYAGRCPPRSIRKAKTQYLHQFLLPGCKQVDHRDGDGLNNRRDNLRAADNLTNHRGFQRKAAGKTSQYRGVYWEPARQKWQAQTKILGKSLPLGRFDSEIEAARAYDAAARKYFGEFASPNFPLTNL